MRLANLNEYCWARAVVRKSKSKATVSSASLTIPVDESFIDYSVTIRSIVLGPYLFSKSIWYALHVQSSLCMFLGVARPAHHPHQPSIICQFLEPRPIRRQSQWRKWVTAPRHCVLLSPAAG